ncbi:MAG: DNA polymerase III subunit beta [Patescibacteria group bacterium]|jgi:DNA polymerase-3 subunit beta
MKISCTQENLHRGLNVISHLAAKNTNLPILNNVLIKTKEGGVVLSATNLEIGINCLVRAKVEKEGVFTAPANLLANFISLLSSEEKVDIELINKELIIQSGNQKTKIKGEDASEFPLIPDVAKEDRYVVKSADLKEALSQVVFASSLDETRIEISGILFNFNKNGLTLAATDSYRLAEKKVSCKEKGKDKQIIIPQRTAAEFLRILAITNEEDVQIYTNDNQVLFSLDQIEVVSRLIEGNYPDYTQIIPKQEKTQIITEKSELITVIKRAALFSKSGINDVNLEFNIDKQLIVVKAASSQVGENLNELPAEIKGDNNSIVFNFRYLLDGLNNLSGNKIILKIIDSGSPGIFRGENEENYLYIIMPIKQ